MVCALPATSPVPTPWREGGWRGRGPGERAAGEALPHSSFCAQTPTPHSFGSLALASSGPRGLGGKPKAAAGGSRLEGGAGRPGRGGGRALRPIPGEPPRSRAQTYLEVWVGSGGLWLPFPDASHHRRPAALGSALATATRPARAGQSLCSAAPARAAPLPSNQPAGFKGTGAPGPRVERRALPAATQGRPGLWACPVGRSRRRRRRRLGCCPPASRAQSADDWVRVGRGEKV